MDRVLGPQTWNPGQRDLHANDAKMQTSYPKKKKKERKKTTSQNNARATNNKGYSRALGLGLGGTFDGHWNTS